MLFIYDRKSKVLNLTSFWSKSGAHDDANRSFLNPFEQRLPLLSAHTSSQEHRPYAQSLKAPVDAEILLFRKDFCGREESNLVAAVERNTCGSNCADRFAAPRLPEAGGSSAQASSYLT